MNGDGGPAFPSGVMQDAYTSGQAPLNDGMTLRDYFAAKAMQSMLCADSDNGRHRSRELAARTAKFAYIVADAMIAERLIVPTS